MLYIRKEKRHDPGGLGQSLVEFAVALPILLLFVAAIIDFGVLFYCQMAVSNAAWEGARAGATIVDPGAGDQEITGAIHSAAHGLNSSRLVIDIDPNQNEIPRNQAFPAPRGALLKVEVGYPVELTFPFISITVTGKAVTRMEYQNP